ncbi:unnamed protein product [Penicillium salamii]|uniref:Membrane insertase YidC/Oxa/ALB C-terminal domain-containing protein n=1 Tax=Penicillium salamii TaxID=1612424 RepID=A0A9W4JHK7_9EURO|nr:unnamed protein product [Penicillium salamii]CAG8335215.1 unnamed protein product [Penicillium salamii]CAG8339547.1 unnamed protein product [Penicillium salamii]CAG8387870.1 unnamed protein product [Penicillium salamii]CAG8395438.1 unnamed protein product [Penicillium salamii]
MLGSKGLKGPSAAAALARQRMTAISRSSRSISTFRSQTLRESTQRAQLKSPLSGNASWRIAPAVAGPAAIRFNSTSSSPLPAEVTPEASATDSLTNLTDIHDITAIPERIGYLKELGLDYGWGPSAVMQWLIEHVHIYSDLPWWASIVAVSVVTRMLLFKPVMDASENAARLTNAKSKIDPLRAKMVTMARDGKQQEAQIVKAQLSQIHKEEGISTMKTVIPMLQIPLGYGCFRTVRGMTSLPVPGIASESVGWINDLTVADPTFILPAVAAGMLVLTLKRGGETGAMPMMDSSAGKSIMYGLPAISFTFMSFMPSALQLYFVASGVFGLTQTHIINSPTFRKWANMTIAKKPVVDGPSESVKNIQSKALRVTLERIEREKAAKKKAYEQSLVQPKEEGPKVSFIDRMLSQGKNLGKNMSKEISEKFGTSSIEERELKEQKKRAGEYEEERRNEDEVLRAQRNEARRVEHMKILENEKNKASQSWKANREGQRGSRRG